MKDCSISISHLEIGALQRRQFKQNWTRETEGGRDGRLWVSPASHAAFGYDGSLAMVRLINNEHSCPPDLSHHPE